MRNSNLNRFNCEKIKLRKQSITLKKSYPKLHYEDFYPAVTNDENGHSVTAKDDERILNEEKEHKTKKRWDRNLDMC